MNKVLLAAGAATIALALSISATAQPRPAGGTVTYWMSAETTSGMAASAGQATPRGMLGALVGGRPNAGPAYVRNLTLQLGSPRAASGTPTAEHLPPSGLGAGPSLPLTTPQNQEVRETNPYIPDPATTPRGKILIYWGCGENVRQNQPIEIDLARLSRGEVPAAAGITYQAMIPPSPATARTYGHWPNERARTTVPATASLVGDHVVRGNYSPEIRFALAQGQDFLGPINVTRNEAAASGAVPVAWQAVPNALGYFLMSTGSRQDGTIVMWSSSEVQLQQMGLYDYLAPAEVARLIQQRVVLGPQTTQCTIPAEVASSVQAATLMLNAFGPEANFSHPVRPANAGRNWAPEWTAKLRTRASYVGMLGMDMEAMMRGGDNSREAPSSAPTERRRRRLNPLERILGR